MKTVCLVAKGPSAVHAEEFLQTGDDVAVVNDAGALLSESRQIDFLFFSDGKVLSLTAGHRNRVRCFVSRQLVKRDLVFVDDLLNLTQYADRGCCGDDASMIARIVAGGITHHHTTTGAIHWLAKHGRYEMIRVIGVDGGSDYAESVTATCTERKFDLTHWADIDRRLSKLITKIYGTQFEWYQP